MLAGCAHYLKAQYSSWLFLRFDNSLMAMSIALAFALLAQNFILLIKRLLRF